MAINGSLDPFVVQSDGISSLSPDLKATALDERGKSRYSLAEVVTIAVTFGSDYPALLLYGQDV
jgi:hypothetical protein